MNRRIQTLIAFTPLIATAEEGGSGHYLPGSMSSFADGIGYIVLMPLMFIYKACDDVNFNFRIAAYAPTG